MLVYERQKQILDLLKKEQFVTVTYLCNKLFASNATIRRDLNEMAKKGLLMKVRGGATLIESNSEDAPLLLRSNTEIEKKRKIALLALHYIKEGDTLFLDSSSTVSTLAGHLNKFSHLSIVTNGFTTSCLINDMPYHKLYLCGGRMQNCSSIVGPMAEETIRKFSTDKLFFSCCGLSTHAGITEANEYNATIKRLMVRNAKERILLCDSTKFNQEFLCKTCGLDSVDVIITDEKPPQYFMDSLPSSIRIIYQ